MTIVTGHHKVYKDLCDALGLKNVEMLKLHFSAHGIVRVVAKFYPELNGVRQFPAILKKYELHEISEDNHDITTNSISTDNNKV